MKIAVLIPTRGDRPELFKNCLRMIKAQTLQPDHVEIVNDPPLSEQKDITWRYRTGYDRLRNKGFDVIAFIEDDDWYSPNYLEAMMAKWLDSGKPVLLGTSYTIYYHIKLFSHYKMEHYSRSSAMSTFIKPDMDFGWCPDYEPYTDMHLWMVEPRRGLVFTPDTHICMGIKHGVGQTGGMSHTTHLHRYKFPDPDKSFLRSIVDPVSFEFYSNYFENDKSTSPITRTA